MGWTPCSDRLGQKIYNIPNGKIVPWVQSTYLVHVFYKKAYMHHRYIKWPPVKVYDALWIGRSIEHYRQVILIKHILIRSRLFNVLFLKRDVVELSMLSDRIMHLPSSCCKTYRTSLRHIYNPYNLYSAYTQLYRLGDREVPTRATARCKHYYVCGWARRSSWCVPCHAIIIVCSDLYYIVYVRLYLRIGFDILFVTDLKCATSSYIRENHAKCYSRNRFGRFFFKC